MSFSREELRKPSETPRRRVRKRQRQRQSPPQGIRPTDRIFASTSRSLSRSFGTSRLGSHYSEGGGLGDYLKETEISPLGTFISQRRCNKKKEK